MNSPQFCDERFAEHFRSTVEALVEEGYELLYGGGYSDSASMHSVQDTSG